MQIFYMKKIYIKNKEQGFTIIETLVAITILMVAIVGPLTVANKGLIASVYARDQMIGSYLAQDAMEFLKNLRDNNKLNSRAWLTNISDASIACTVGSRCNIDTVKGDPVSGSGSVGWGRASCATQTLGCAQLSLIGSGINNGYVVSPIGATLTQFYRTYYVTPIDTNDPTTAKEARLSVVVSWKNGTLSNSVTIDSIIYDTFH